MKNNTIMLLFLVSLNLLFLSIYSVESSKEYRQENEKIRKQIEKVNYKIEIMVANRLDFFESKYYWIEKNLNELKIICKE